MNQRYSWKISGRDWKRIGTLGDAREVAQRAAMKLWLEHGTIPKTLLFVRDIHDRSVSAFTVAQNNFLPNKIEVRQVAYGDEG